MVGADLPSLPRLEVPDIAPWTDSEAWLKVFLVARWLVNGRQAAGRREGKAGQGLT